VSHHLPYSVKDVMASGGRMETVRLLATATELARMEETVERLTEVLERLADAPCACRGRRPQCLPCAAREALETDEE